MNILYSTVNTLRDRYTPAKHTSTFRKTGEITPEEFVAAGDYLVYKFPTWSWADAAPTSRRSANLPPGKQFLITRNVPCHRRLDEEFAGAAGSGKEDDLVEASGAGAGGDGDDDEDGWLRTGGAGATPAASKLQTTPATGSSAARAAAADDDEDDDDIPDMEEEEDDEAIIPEVTDPKR